MKLNSVYFTIADKVKSQSIEQKTKHEIIEMILDLATKFEYEEFESIKAVCSMSKTKQFLINSYQELLDSQLHEKLDMNIAHQRGCSLTYIAQTPPVRDRHNFLGRGIFWGGGFF